MGLFRRRPPARHAAPGGDTRLAQAVVPPWEEAGWTPPAYAQPYLEAAPFAGPTPFAEPEQQVDPAPYAEPTPFAEPALLLEPVPFAEPPSYLPPPFAFAEPPRAADPVAEWEPVAALPVVPAPALPEPEPALRVELGFRDGSTAALAPDSVQARALSAVAEVLVRRD
jgi:hypothetical protein